MFPWFLFPVSHPSFLDFLLLDPFSLNSFVSMSFVYLVLYIFYIFNLLRVCSS
jgi:hypothetical protein